MDRTRPTYDYGKNKSSNIKDKILNNISYFVIFFLIICVIFTLLLIFKVPFTGTDTTDTKALNYSFIVITFVMFLLFFTAVTILPVLKDFKTFLLQIHNVFYVVLYVIFLILLFGYLPSNVLNTYAYIITPATILFSAYLFYKSFNTNYITEFNVNYERIKSMILFFCLIALFIIYYVKDPGGYITKYFGFSSVFTIILSIFSFLYLVILLTLPDVFGENKSTTTDSLLNKFSTTSVFGTISFFVFLIIVTVTLSIMKGEDSSYYNSVLPLAVTLTMICCIFWSLILIPNLFPELTNASNVLSKLDLYKKGLLVLFSIIIAIFIILFITYNVQQSSSLSSIILNIILILIVLTIIYKTIIIDLPYGNSKKNSFFDLIISTIFFIPCILSNTFNFFYDFFKEQYNLTTWNALNYIFYTLYPK